MNNFDGQLSLYGRNETKRWYRNSYIRTCQLNYHQ